MDAVIFIYRLKGLNKSKRNLFNYVLSGRKMERGLLEEVGGFYLGKGALVVPKETEKEIEDVFRNFGISFLKLPVTVDAKVYAVVKKLLKKLR